MVSRAHMVWGMALLLLAGASPAEAGARACRLWNCGVGGSVGFDDTACAPCEPIQWQEVECQVMVPQTTYETRKIVTTEYRTEMQERTVTRYKSVPRELTRQVNYTVCDPVVRERDVNYVTCRPVWEEKQVPYTYMVPVYEQKQATRTVMDPVWEDVQRSFTVMIPEVRWHTGTRMVCRMEPVTTSRTICVDRGHWETEVIGMATACNPCDPCQTVCRPITRPVWKPCLVQQQIPCTTYRPVQVPVEYRYCTTHCRPETRTCTQRVCRYQPREVAYNYTVCRYVPKTETRTIRVCRYVQETHTRKQTWTEMVPRTETRTENYTVYDCVPTQHTVQVPVCVPVSVEKEISVPVCRMVPQTVTRRVPVACPTCVQ